MNVMEDYGPFHAKVFYIKGLHLGNERFVWNGKLLLISSGERSSNIAEAHILFDTPMPEFGQRDERKQEKDHIESVHFLSIFLACFRLVNDHSELELDSSQSMEHPVKSIEEFKTEESYVDFEDISELAEYPVEQCKKFLENTALLFDKVMKNMVFKQRNAKNPLSISLPLFQRITDRGIETIIDYTTVLESLVCENEGELRYKFSLRISLLIDKDPEKRKDTFEFLKQIYSIRSNLIHGSEINIEGFLDDDYGIILRLESIVNHALFEYIELVYSGLSKKDVIAKLDSMALE